MPRALPATIRVRIDHAHPLVACGLEHVLERLDGVEVLPYEGGVLPADVVIADSDTGLDIARVVRRGGGAHRAFGPKVVIVGGEGRSQDVRDALEAGVAGYLQLDCTPERLHHCLRQVTLGSRYLDGELALRMADSLSHEPLTGRETEVLRVLAVGLCNKSIAGELGISVGTVKAHLKAIMSKLGASSRTEAASIALQRGLVGERQRESHARTWAGDRREAGGAMHTA